MQWRTTPYEVFHRKTMRYILLKNQGIEHDDPASNRTAARLEDVAALAGVSTATASKALHNKPRISEETKQRVLDAAKQLNYSPNKLAQSLARGTTGTIGLVTSDLQGRFSTPILIARENELRAQSTSVLLATLVATPPWNVSMSRNCCPSRSTDCSSCSARPTPGPRLAMTGACHWSTSTAPPPTPKTARSLATTWTPAAWPSTISSRVAAGTSPLSAATKPIPLPPTAPRARSRHSPN